MSAVTGELHDFYLPECEWAPVYTQGDVIRSVPRVLIASGSVPGGGTAAAPVEGAANYCHTTAMVISPTCNIPVADLIQFATVEPVLQMGAGKLKELKQGRRHKEFLLPDLAGQGHHVVQLTDVWSLPRHHFEQLDRVVCLSGWARHLLADALYRAFARPITQNDVSFDISLYAGCLPAK